MSVNGNGNGNGNGEFARRVAENTVLTALNRIGGAFGLPIALLLLAWFGTSMVAIQKDVAVIKVQLGGTTGSDGLIGDTKKMEGSIEDHERRLTGLESWWSNFIGAER